MQRLRLMGHRVGVDGALLSLLVLMAFAVREYGVGWGFPDLLYGDEHDVAGQALRMIMSLDFAPDRFFKTATYSYMLIPIFVPLAIWLFGGFLLGIYDSPAYIELWRYYYLARSVSALFGAATVVVVFLIAKRLFGRPAAFMAALLFSFDVIHVDASHYAKAYAPSAFFALLSFFFVLKLFDEGRPRHYLAAGLMAGLATAIQYNAALVLLPLTLAHFLRLPRGKPWHTDSRRFLLSLGSVALGFVVANPFLMPQAGQFLSAMQAQFNALVPAAADVSMTPAAGSRLFPQRASLYLATMVSSAGMVATALGLLGCLYALVRFRTMAVLQLVFVVPTVLLLAQYYIFSPPYLAPIMPFVYIFAGVGLMVVVRSLDNRWPGLGRFVMVGGLAMALWVPASASVAADRSLAALDTRVLAKQWIAANLPPTSRIAREEFVVAVQGYNTREYWMLDQNGQDFDWYLRRGFTHVVVTNWHKRSAGFESALQDHASLLMEIPAEAGRRGPTIRIYQIESARMITPLTPTKTSFGGSLRLQGYEMDRTELKPGEYFNVALYLQGAKSAKQGEIVLTVEKNGKPLIQDIRSLAEVPVTTVQTPAGETEVIDYDLFIPQAEWFSMNDAEQQRYLNPDLERGLRLGLGRRGSLFLQHIDQPSGEEVIRLTLERQIRGGRVLEQKDAITSLYSARGAEPGKYDVWLEMRGVEGNAPTAKSGASRFHLGTIEVTS